MVLDRGDGTLSSPVDGVGEVGGIEMNWLLGTESIRVSVTEHSLPFSRSVSGEFVETNGVSNIILGVVLFNKGKSFLKLFSSEFKFLLSSEGLTIFGNPLHEFVVNSLHHFVKFIY